MTDDLAVLRAEVGRGDEAVFQTVDARVLADDPAELLGKDLFDQRGNVGVVVVEGVPVNPAFIGDVPDGNPAQRTLGEQFEKGIADRGFGLTGKTESLLQG